MGTTTRRKFFARLGLTLVSLIGIAWIGKRKLLTWLVRRENKRFPEMSDAPKLEEEFCVLTSPVPEGPYYIKTPLRSDIRENKQGKNLQLKLQVISHPSCTPIENAAVEIWHCDAEGNYSGYPDGIGHNIWEFAKLTKFGSKQRVETSNEQQYLRGHQKSDTTGVVVFNTIVPGWYDPRVPHIHVKIMIENKAHFTTQLYFDESFCNEVYTSEALYNQYGKSPYNFKNDKSMARLEEAKGLILNPTKLVDGSTLATVRIGVKEA